MIITLTLPAGNTYAIDTNSFSLSAYQRICAFANVQPNLDVTVMSYHVDNSGMLIITEHPVSWSGKPTPVPFTQAIAILSKLLA